MARTLHTGRPGGSGVGYRRRLTTGRAYGGSGVLVPGPNAPAAAPLDLTPPLGFYDPAIDANAGASQRGFENTSADIGKAKDRLTTDYGVGVADINLGASRAQEDIATRRQQGTEDYGTQTDALVRNFQQLAGRQRQQANAGGVLRGGALLASALKRTANQKLGQDQLDTGYSRLLQGLQTASTRTGENQSEALQKLALQSAPADQANPEGGRSWQDLVTQGTRAGVENTAFQGDSQTARIVQAAQQGYSPAVDALSPHAGPQHFAAVTTPLRRRLHSPALGRRRF